MADATDYTVTDKDAKMLLGAVSLPHDLRTAILKNHFAGKGSKDLIELFSHFIGLANSVVANNREMIELIGLCSGELNPHNAHQVNLPTLFGALQGVINANSVDAEKACAGCAYRLGTPANQSPTTSSDADFCLKSNVDFMCHEDMDHKGDPIHLCVGHALRRHAQEFSADDDMLHAFSDQLKKEIH